MPPPLMILLFALDPETKEAVISSSKNGSNDITSISRVSQDQNPELHAKISELDRLVHSGDFSAQKFKNIHKQCQKLWTLHMMKNGRRKL